MGRRGFAARLLTAVLVGALLPGCTATRFVPQASSGPSPVTIAARVTVDPFTAAAEAFDADVVPVDPATNVRDALISDFSTGQVFTDIGASLPNADLVLRGEVRALYGRYGTTTAGWLSLLTLWVAAYTGIPLNYSEGAADLHVTIARPDGAVVGQYAGRSTFDRTYSINDDLSAGLSKVTQIGVDQALSQALEHIRDQILQDRERLARR